jgi:RNA polymerase sigma factor (sigma-70 family)
VTAPAAAEDLVRQLAPRVLGAVVRRYGHFDDAEDAVQEALMAAATMWPVDGQPDQPLAWLVRVASRRMADRFRSDEARRRRELLAASLSVTPPEPVSGHDDTLVLIFMCCDPTLSAGSAIPLTLRAVGGLTTREIAAAFLVPEATMAQRISRAKAALKTSERRFSLPSPEQMPERLRAVLHVLYLMFNEGYATSVGPELTRTDLSGEAIRLTRFLHAGLPESPEAAGLLALMLLTDSRRAARTTADGELVPLTEQDRDLWDGALIFEGLSLLTGALSLGRPGEYQVQAAIAGVHAQSRSQSETDWHRIAELYELLERMTGNPVVRLNRAVAVAFADGPDAGLVILESLDEQLGDHYRLRAVRGHLLERAGERAKAAAEFSGAAAGTRNLREQQYLTTKAAQLRAEPTES